MRQSIKRCTFDSCGFKLDVLVNNAAIFDDLGPRKDPDGRFELTFAVNVIAPFIITYKLLEHAYQCKSFIKKVVNTSSISHTDCYHHLQEIDYSNLQFENGLKWTSFNSYGLSKQLVIMFTRGFFYEEEWNMDTHSKKFDHHPRNKPPPAYYFSCHYIPHFPLPPQPYAQVDTTPAPRFVGG